MKTTKKTKTTDTLEAQARALVGSFSKAQIEMMEIALRDHAKGLNRDGFTGLGMSAENLRRAAELAIAKIDAYDDRRRSLPPAPTPKVWFLQVMSKSHGTLTTTQFTGCYEAAQSAVRSIARDYVGQVVCGAKVVGVRTSVTPK